jgi:hypothetical protein
MMHGTTLERTTVRREPAFTQQLVYFDPQGKRYVGDDHRIAEDMLRLFSQRVKAVRRSTGGLVLAEPFELIVYGDPTRPARPEDYRVRVKFRDFRRDAEGRVLLGEIATHVKTLPASELLEPFHFDGDTPGCFLLDFGDGIVPVNVVLSDGRGNGQAFFVEPDAIERVRTTRQDENVLIQPYRVERTVLRWTPIDKEGGAPDERRAWRNYHRLVDRDRQAIPPVLAFGAPIAIPGGSTTEEVRQFLRMKLRQRLTGKAESLVYRIEGEELQPLDE